MRKEIIDKSQPVGTIQKWQMPDGGSFVYRFRGPNETFLLPAEEMADFLLDSYVAKEAKMIEMEVQA
jgi:hypothetical protein